ncbi:MAG TPA: oligosaccharide flippase family protein [Solirubrobacterales bacterium]|nr:oligosaccharide flippase family protein [Solirubrobacterales bacterium]
MGVRSHQPPGAPIAEPDPQIENFEAAAPPDGAALGQSAARGVSLLVARTLGFQLLTAGVTVVLARLLTPADYGLFAIALSVQLVGQNVAELGLPAALVRMPETPSRQLQAATIGFLLAITLSASIAMLVIAFGIVPALAAPSDTLRVIAITLLALPIYAARAVPMAMMDRELHFGRVAAVEAADTIGFNVFALIAALAGLGVFSLAGAVPVGAVLGAGVAWSTQSAARRPRFELSRVRPLIGFGSRVSVLGVLYLGRDLGYVTLVGAIGGAPVAGFYGMAKRLFSFPTALAAAVARVMLPTLSQSGDERPARTARMLGQIALVCGLPLAIVAGAIQPFIQVVLGTEWLPTSDIVIYGSLAMLLGASIASPINSFCLAEGKPNTPVAAIAAELTVGFGLVALLIGPFDESGIGAAMSIGAAIGAAILLATTRPQVRAGTGKVIRVAAISFVAAAAGQLLAADRDVAGLVLAIGVSGAAWVVLAVAFLRDDLARALGVARGLLPGAAR